MGFLAEMYANKSAYEKKKKKARKMLDKSTPSSWKKVQEEITKTENSSQLPILIEYTTYRETSQFEDSISWHTTLYRYYLVDLDSVISRSEYGDKTERDMIPGTLDLSEVRPLCLLHESEIIENIKSTVIDLSQRFNIENWKELKKLLKNHYLEAQKD